MATKDYKPSKARKLAQLNLKPGHVIKAEEFNAYISVLATQLNQIDDYTARIYKLLGGRVPSNVYDFSNDDNPFTFHEDLESRNVLDAISEIVTKGGKEKVWTDSEEPDPDKFNTWFKPIDETENELQIIQFASFDNSDEYQMIDESPELEWEEPKTIDTSKEMEYIDVKKVVENEIEYKSPSPAVGDEIRYEKPKTYDDSPEIKY